MAPVPLAETVWAFPLVGAGIGLAAGGALLAAAWAGLPALACAFVALTVSAVLTGALHEDGLADTADGFGGGDSLERKMEIMRDSRIGAYGVLALILGVGLRAALLSGLPAPLAAAALVAAAALSRAAMPAARFALEPARAEGLGARAGRPGGPAMAAAVVICGLVAVLALDIGTGAAALAGAAAGAALLAGLAKSQIGGYTGDVLGAIQQASEIGVLTVVVAVTAMSG